MIPRHLALLFVVVAAALTSCISETIPPDARLDEVKLAADVKASCAHLRSKRCVGDGDQCERGLTAAARNGSRIDFGCLTAVESCGGTAACGRAPQ